MSTKSMAVLRQLAAQVQATLVSLAPNDQAKVLAIADALVKGGSFGKAAAISSIPKTTMRDHYWWAQSKLGSEEFGKLLAERRRAFKGETASPPLPQGVSVPEGFILVGNVATYNGDGELRTQSIRTIRDAGPEYEVPEGQTVKGVSSLLDSEGRVRASWVKTQTTSTGALTAEALERVFQAYDGKAGIVAPPKVCQTATLSVYPIADLHFGMRAHAGETGSDYTCEISAETVSSSLAALVSRTEASRHAVVLGLGDYFHANGSEPLTPANKHILDVDKPWPQVLDEGIQLAINLINAAARKHETVEVVFMPGNHDRDSALALQIALKYFYSKTPRITISYVSENRCWYYRAGSVFLGGIHGHTLKMEAMPMLMAEDRPDDWAASKHRYFFSGHFHRELSKRIGSVHVECCPTVTARDAWTQSKGYRSARVLQAIDFHVQKGLRTRHYEEV